MSNDIVDLSFEEIRIGLRTGQFSVEELVWESIKRARHNEDLRAWSFVDEEGALSASRKLDRELKAGTTRGPLHGIPMGFKASIAVQGMPFDAGLNLYEGITASKDSSVAAKLRAAGVIPIGMQVMHGGGIGDVVRDGPRATSRNPWDNSYVPSGSSCGSAVATATRSCVMSVGTDTGGSVRGPASSCGVLGFKPSRGSVESQGTTPLSWSLDTLGFFGRDVDALSAVVESLGIGRTEAFAKPLSISVLSQDSFGVLSDEIADVMQAAITAVKSSEMSLVESRPVKLERATELWAHRMAEMAAIYSREEVTHLELIPPTLQKLISRAATVKMDDYALSWIEGEQLATEIDRAIGHCDVLMLPATPERTLKWAQWNGPGESGSRVQSWYGCLSPFNLTGHPAVTIPWTLLDDKIPCSIQLVALRGDDSTLIEATRRLTELSPWKNQLPPDY